MKITQADIAKSLNISRLTVSKALNNASGVSDETRELIFQEARLLGYHHAGKSPDDRMDDTTGEPEDSVRERMVTKQISLFLEPQLASDSYWAPVIRGIGSGLMDHGYNLNLCFLTVNEENEVEIPSNFNPHNCSGIIQFGDFRKGNIKQFKSFDLPIVSIDATMHGDDICLYADTIMTFSTEPMITMVEHLVAQGYQRIGYASDGGMQLAMHERWLGYCQGLQKAGLPLHDNFYFLDTFENIVQSIEREHRLDDLSTFPDVMMCCNDMLAISFLRFFQSKGISVPETIGLSGYDNLREAEIVNLTTINVNREELGLTAAEALLWRIENPHRPYRMLRICDNALVIRNSTRRF